MRIFESVKTVTSVAPVTAATGAITGGAIDTREYGDAMAVVSVGVTSGTPDSFAVAAKIQHSEDGSTSWADVTGASITSVIAAGKTAEIAIDTEKHLASRRFIRLVVTPSFVGGTSPKVGVSGVVLLGNPTYGGAPNSGVGN